MINSVTKPETFLLGVVVGVMATVLVEKLGY